MNVLVRAAIAVVPPLIALAGARPALGAQQPATPRDSLRLAVLQTEAVHADPRQRELALDSAASALRVRNIGTDRLPAFSANGTGQYQSQVATIPLALPNLNIPAPPHDTYDAHVNAQESLYNPTIAPRLGVERAQLAVSQDQVRTTLHGLRQEVNAAFFAAATLQQRSVDIAAAVTDLQARLSEAVDRVAAGTSLPSDTSAIEAAILQRRQDEASVGADRRAAIAQLSALVGHTLADSDALALPDQAAAVAAAAHELDSLRARPEYQQFADTRAQLDREAGLDAAQLKPQVSAFVRAGYGRPGLNPLNTAFTSYWLGGIQFQWTPWDWGTTDRSREALALQQQAVSDEEAAFTSQLRRSIQDDLATM
ncbi:MAG TPA: TolC family protein, partial [Gemmatimonadaceae bacterium]|nr:TolC family protein [Gemmatimonadaceae bacterium]